MSSTIYAGRRRRTTRIARRGRGLGSILGGLADHFLGFGRRKRRVGGRRKRRVGGRRRRVGRPRKVGGRRRRVHHRRRRVGGRRVRRGRGIWSTITNLAKKAHDYIKDNKLISRGASTVGKFLGHPNAGNTIGKVAGVLGYGRRRRGGALSQAMMKRYLVRDTIRPLLASGGRRRRRV